MWLSRGQVTSSCLIILSHGKPSWKHKLSVRDRSRGTDNAECEINTGTGGGTMDIDIIDEEVMDVSFHN